MKSSSLYELEISRLAVPAEKVPKIMGIAGLDRLVMA